MRAREQPGDVDAAPREPFTRRHNTVGVNRNGLLVGVAAVLFGITVLMLISGLAVSPVLLFVAIPFGAAAYLIWYHATGRLAERVRSNPDAFSRGARENVSGGRPGGASAGRRFGGDRGDERRRTREGGPSATPRLTRAEAARILGVKASADSEAIKRAYRRKVKTSHPDAPDGDEETFKSVRRAYERLSE